MRIQHNIMAMSAYRNYTNNVSAMRKNLEKLSSGYKINRAGDDAAGLAISEKMRAQITGLETAQKNAKDGISLVQTAEGALTEVHDMLNRMVELATMSANGTYDNTTDRAQLQKELDQLRDEIDRIADSANFNGIKLLDGSMDQGGRSVDADVTILPNDVLLADNGFVGEGTLLKRTGNSSSTLTFGVQFDQLKVIAEAGDELEVTIGGEKFTLKFQTKGSYSAAQLATMLASAANGKMINGGTFTASAAGTVVTFTHTGGSTFDGNMNVTMTLKGTGSLIPLSDDGLNPLDDDGFGINSDGTQTYATGTVNVANATSTKDITNNASAAKVDTWSVTLSLNDQSSNSNLVVNSRIKIGSNYHTLTTDEIDALKASSDTVAALAKIIASNATELGINKTGYEIRASGGKLVFVATKAGVMANPSIDLTGLAIVAEGGDTPITDVTVSAAAANQDITGAAAKPSSKSISISWGNAAALAEAVEGKAGAAVNGAEIKAAMSTDGYVILLAGDVEIGRSTVKLATAAKDNATGNYTIDVMDGNNRLASVTFMGSQANSITKADFGTISSGNTYRTSNTPPPPTGTPVSSTNIAQGIATAGVFARIDGLASTALGTTKLASVGLTTAQINQLASVSIKVGDVTVDLKTALQGMSSSGTTVQEFLSAIKNAASAAISAWNTANPDKNYTYKFVGISFTGSVGDLVTLANNPNGIYIHAEKITKPTPPGSGTGSVNNSYNSGTVNVVQAANAGGDQTASTVIDLKQIFGNDIGDGSSLTIGKTTFNFVWDDAYDAGAGGTTDGTYTIKLDRNATGIERIKQAAAALTHYETGVFSIGNRSAVNGNYGLISVNEKPNGTGDYDTELKSHAGFESLFSAVSNLPKDETKGLSLQIGDTAESYNQLKVSIQDTHCTSLGISGIDISSQDKAAAAIDKIKAAINTVSDVRGTLGATQNRLDHTINNLSVMTENIQDAESTIRDVDIAEEMMAYTKNNILIQSAQAMLAQANQVPQGVLQLLQ